jgi:type IV pilus assembly protein PilF
MQAIVFVLLFLFSASLFTACGGGSFVREDNDQSELQLQVGTQQLQNGNYPAAMASLLKAEQLDPSNPMIQNNLGLAYFVRDHFEEAEKHFEKAISLKRDYTDAKNNAGRTLIELNKYDEALKMLSEAEKDLTYPTPEKPLTNIGIVYFKTERFDLAKKYFAKALAIQRDNCVAYNYYGRSLYELKQFAAASDALDRAVGFCQPMQFDEPQYYSALAHFQAGDREKAEARLEQLIKIYPQGKYKDKSKAMLETMRR